MERWRHSLKNCISTAEELGRELRIDSEPLKEVAERYPLRISRYYLGLISEPGDPIWLQCVPDRSELVDDALLPDPLHEETLSPVPGLIHRYPDRVVWLVSNSCPVYCRFCMRKRRVGCLSARCGDPAEVVAYLSANPYVRDVTLSGGDPLLLGDDELDDLLGRLRTIPHVEIVRIGTRVPVTLPDRITPRLCRMLKRHNPLYINTHFNHPLEITSESSRACSLLADAGLPLGNQTVLLRNVNDDPEVMKKLMRQLLSLRVKPYYLHQMDLVRGTSHFRTSTGTGVEIIGALRGYTSGLAVPHYVVDLPGGKGKVPLLEHQPRKNGKITLRNYTGQVIEYPDLP